MKDSGCECSYATFMRAGNQTVHWESANSKIGRAAAGRKIPKSIESHKHIFCQDFFFLTNIKVSQS